MPTPPIRYDGHSVDLSGRFFNTTIVTGSPAAAAETIIATLTIGEDVAVQKAVYLAFVCAFTVGTSGVTTRLRLKRTDTSGTTLFDSGLCSATAATLVEMSALGVDTAAVMPGQVYVATLIVGSGAAASTVSAVNLIGVVV